MPAGGSRRVGTRFYDDSNMQLVAYTDTAAASSAIAAAEVSIVSTTDCYVAFGSAPTASIAAGSMFLPAGVIFTRKITPTWKVSAIQVSANGNLCVMPVLP